MGEVFLGIDPTLNRPAAIKRLTRDLVEDADALGRFKREARATASVSHPNIAGIYSVGTSEDGRPFLAMEYVDGMNLVEVIRQKLQMPYSNICEWMIQACQGLQSAYKANIVHRDLKPGNLMITRDGDLKIVDFGLAKVFFEDTHKTQTGTVIGTPQYMSPEQGQGRGIDHRSDIYSLGATFYCLLAGRPPFDGPSLVDVMMKHIASPLVPIYSINPGVPLPLCDIVHRMMAKDPNDRPQDYEDLIADLKAVKLQMLARERGSFVGEGEVLFQPVGHEMPPTVLLPPHENEVAQSESDADLKAIVGKARRGVPVPADDPVTMHSMEVKKEASDNGGNGAFWGTLQPKQRLWLGVGVAILVIVVVALFLNPGGRSDDSGPGSSSLQDPSTQKAISLVLTRSGTGETAGTPVPMPAELRAAVETRARLTELSRAAQAYEAARGRLPASLHALVEAQLIDEDRTLDAWTRPFIFRRVTQEIVSYGIDGEENTPDDIAVRIGDTPILPKPYQQMEDNYRKQLQASE